MSRQDELAFEELRRKHEAYKKRVGRTTGGTTLVEVRKNAAQARTEAENIRAERIRRAAAAEEPYEAPVAVETDDPNVDPVFAEEPAPAPKRAPKAPAAATENSEEEVYEDGFIKEDEIDTENAFSGVMGIFRKVTGKLGKKKRTHYDDDEEYEDDFDDSDEESYEDDDTIEEGDDSEVVPAEETGEETPEEESESDSANIEDIGEDDEESDGDDITDEDDVDEEYEDDEEFDDYDALDDDEEEKPAKSSPFSKFLGMFISRDDDEEDEDDDDLDEEYDEYLDEDEDIDDEETDLNDDPGHEEPAEVPSKANDIADDVDVPVPAAADIADDEIEVNVAKKPATDIDFEDSLDTEDDMDFEDEEDEKPAKRFSLFGRGRKTRAQEEDDLEEESFEDDEDDAFEAKKSQKRGLKGLFGRNKPAKDEEFDDDEDLDDFTDNVSAVNIAPASDVMEEADRIESEHAFGADEESGEKTQVFRTELRRARRNRAAASVEEIAPAIEEESDFTDETFFAEEDVDPDTLRNFDPDDLRTAFADLFPEKRPAKEAVKVYKRDTASPVRKSEPKPVQVKPTPAPEKPVDPIFGGKSLAEEISDNAEQVSSVSRRARRQMADARKKASDLENMLK